MGVADDEVNAGLGHSRNDLVAVAEGECHRLFQDDVLAGGGSANRMGGMELVRRRDVDGSDRRVLAQRADIRIGARVEVAREGLAWGGERIGRGAQAESGMPRRRPHHHGARHAEPGNAEPDWVAIGAT